MPWARFNSRFALILNFIQADLMYLNNFVRTQMTFKKVLERNNDIEKF